MISALALGVVVVLVALIAYELGATARGQLVAAAATAAATVTMAAGHIVSTATFDLFFWIAILWLVVRLLEGGDPRLWLGVGAVTGISLQNKHLAVLLVLALAVGIVLARAWGVVRTPWLPAGAVLAGAIWLPNLAWQAANGWPQIELGRQIADEDPVGVRVGLIPLQLLILGLPLVPLAAGGLWWLLRGPRESGLRAIGYGYLSLLVVCLVVGAKPYYPAPFTLFLLAPGAFVADGWLRRRGRPATLAVGGAIAASAVLSALVVLPLVPVRHLHSVPRLRAQRGLARVGRVARLCDAGRERLARTDARGAGVRDDLRLELRRAGSDCAVRPGTRPASRLLRAQRSLEVRTSARRRGARDRAGLPGAWMARRPVRRLPGSRARRQRARGGERGARRTDLGLPCSLEALERALARASAPRRLGPGRRTGQQFRPRPWHVSLCVDL